MTPPPILRAGVVLVAAGRSTRFLAGSRAADAVRKPFLELGGRTVLERAVEPFDALEAVRDIVLVVHREDLDAVQRLVERSTCMTKLLRIVEGGAERFDSVRIGVDALPEDLELIAVHDAARPLVTREVVQRALEVAGRAGAALVATPARDTIKTSSTGESAESTLDRTVLWAAQTPQVFRADRLRELLARAGVEGWKPTDESALHERYLGPIPLVEGAATNLKITTQADFVIADAIVRAREQGRPV